jgi:predicted anti-sigma-YlaC factor YlaD
MSSKDETSEHETLRALVDEHFTVGLRADREARLRAHLPTCPRCRSAYEAYQIAERLDPAAVPARARERLARSLGFGAETRGRTRVLGWTGATLATVGAAIVLLAVGRPLPGGGPAPVARGGQVDGAGALEVAAFRIHGGSHSTRIAHTVSADDELAFAYRNEVAKAFLMIFAVDGDGRVLWYHPAWTNPADNPRALPITTQVGFKELPEAIRQSLRGPRLVLYSLFMDQPLDVRTVEARIAAAGGLFVANPSAGEVLSKVAWEVQP